MAETIRQVDYYYVETPNKPGEAARALAAVKDAGVNLLAFSGFPSGRKSQLDFVPAPGAGDHAPLPHETDVTGHRGLRPREFPEQLMLGEGSVIGEAGGDADSFRMAKDLEDPRGATQVDFGGRHQARKTLQAPACGRRRVPIRVSLVPVESTRGSM